MGRGCRRRRHGRCSPGAAMNRTARRSHGTARRLALRSSLFLACALPWLACSDGAAPAGVPDASVDASPLPSETPNETAGTRLRPVYQKVSASDGTYTLDAAAWWDEQLGDYCSLRARRRRRDPLSAHPSHGRGGRVLHRVDLLPARRARGGRSAAEGRVRVPRPDSEGPVDVAPRQAGQGLHRRGHPATPRRVAAVPVGALPARGRCL